MTRVTTKVVQHLSGISLVQCHQKERSAAMKKMNGAMRKNGMRTRTRSTACGVAHQVTCGGTALSTRMLKAMQKVLTPVSHFEVGMTCS